MMVVLASFTGLRLGELQALTPRNVDLAAGTVTVTRQLQRSRLEKEREELAKGTGRYRNHPVAQAIRTLADAESDVARLERNLRGGGGNRKDRRAWRAELEQSRRKRGAAARAVADLSAPELDRLDKDDQRLQERVDGLWEQQGTYQSWASRHPEAEGRLDALSVEIASLDDALGRKPPGRDLPPSLQPDRWAHLLRGQDRNLGLDLGR